MNSHPVIESVTTQDNLYPQNRRKSFDCGQLGGNRSIASSGNEFNETVANAPTWQWRHPIRSFRSIMNKKQKDITSADLFNILSFGDTPVEHNKNVVCGNINHAEPNEVLSQRVVKRMAQEYEQNNLNNQIGAITQQPHSNADIASLKKYATIRVSKRDNNCSQTVGNSTGQIKGTIQSSEEKSAETYPIDFKNNVPHDQLQEQFGNTICSSQLQSNSDLHQLLNQFAERTIMNHGETGDDDEKQILETQLSALFEAFYKLTEVVGKQNAIAKLNHALLGGPQITPSVFGETGNGNRSCVIMQTEDEIIIRDLKAALSNPQESARNASKVNSSMSEGIQENHSGHDRNEAISVNQESNYNKEPPVAAPRATSAIQQKVHTEDGQAHPPVALSRSKVRPETTPTRTRITDDLASRINQRPDKFVALFFVNEGNSLMPERIPREDDSWKWDDSMYARVPLSASFKSKCQTGTNNKDFKKQWNLIVRELKNLKRVDEKAREDYCIGERIQEAITNYSENSDKSDFEILNRADLADELRKTIPLIVTYALSLPNLLAKPVPILTEGESKTLYVTKELACSLLANAFFCTFPEEEDPMPDFNFFKLFESSSPSSKDNIKAEKLKCILNYFEQMKTLMTASEGKVSNSHIISFERRCITEHRDWSTSEAELIDVQIEPKKGIEEANGMLQMDFANKVVGGGVLNKGAVMEEIRFCICPELLISRLFTEPLDDDEVLVITGIQQFSKYSGYGPTFKYDGPFEEPLSEKKDNIGRNYTQVAAIDALPFRPHEKCNQFQESNIERELHKCYVAFVRSQRGATPVATGNWGCGAFNGDPELKFLIQWMAASVAGRPSLYYHTIGDQHQSDSIQDIVMYIKQKNLCVGSLYDVVVEYKEEMSEFQSIFDYVRVKLVESDKSLPLQKNDHESESDCDESD